MKLSSVKKTVVIVVQQIIYPYIKQA